jgi:hypothetical protein
VTPMIRGFGFALTVAALFGLLFVAAWNWDPFHRRRSAELRSAKSADLATSATLTAQGAGDATRRLEDAVRLRDAARAATAILQAKAQQSEDAHAIIAPDRARRLLDHDRELCELAPDLRGCGASGSDAAGG